MVKAIILAAGKGTRMKSRLPKVLHPVNGRPMINQVLKVLEEVGISQMVAVLGHGADEVEKNLSRPLQVVLQKEQLGTGHAVLQAAPYLEENEDVLVICGDTPLFRPETIRNLLETHKESGAAVTVLTGILSDAAGYGRILRDATGSLVEAIVEEKDASPEQKKIREMNTGTYVFSGSFLKEAIYEIRNDNNAQGEYYLTDLLKIARAKNMKTGAAILADVTEALGINDRVQLAEAGQILRNRKIRQLMLDGVTIIAPDTVYIESEVEIGQDVVLQPNVMIQGRTTIGPDCEIGPDVRIVDSQIGQGNTIERAKIVETTIANHCSIGPYAYLRPGANLSDNVKIGDFVEVKKSNIGPGSKIPHLSYVGDAEVGSNVNIGCGTITCNYDGKNKHTTVLSDNAFIGSNTNLVAPVTVGTNAYVGAGSTITMNVPDSHLAVARGRQRNIPIKNKDR